MLSDVFFFKHNIYLSCVSLKRSCAAREFENLGHGDDEEELESGRGGHVGRLVCDVGEERDDGGAHALAQERVAPQDGQDQVLRELADRKRPLALFLLPTFHRLAQLGRVREACQGLNLLECLELYDTQRFS